MKILEEIAALCDADNKKVREDLKKITAHALADLYRLVESKNQDR